MKTTTQRAEKIFSRIDELAAITEVPGGITRVFGTTEFLEGAALVLKWMREAGLEARVDAIGNVRGILRCADAGARTFVIGSHIDTVKNAGRFDGPLGVLAGLDLLEELIGSGRPAPFHIELIAFSDEEGVRYQTTYLGSKVVAGHFEEALLERKDGAGITLREALEPIHAGMPELPAERAGATGAAQAGGAWTSDAIMGRLRQEALAPGSWLGYFELHIEQGPVLYERKIPVAIVTAIAGQLRAEIVFRGEAGHAGTVPMNMRRDALCAAAEFILELEKMALGSKGGIMATAGRLDIENSAGNVIPGEVICSLDLRSADQSVLDLSYKKIREVCQQIANRRNIALEWRLLQESRPVSCDPELNALLGKAVRAAGYEAVELVSGAGHDAVPLSLVSPVSMLFLRCFKGISHNPLENVELEDLAATIEVMDRFIHQLTELWKYQP
ncbi:MAG TPA: M20 family metallo-hydrolase [Puia sp.]|nr:M20 family metallo-hydrolase [Puia sp.]